MKGHFEEVDGDKYLIISSENSNIMKKCQEVFDGIKEIIKKMNDYGQPIKYDDSYMKIKFNTDDNILLNKIIYFPMTTVIIRSITQKDDKYYPQLSLMNVCIKYTMLEYDRIDISEGIDTDKTSASKECIDLPLLVFFR